MSAVMGGYNSGKESPAMQGNTKAPINELSDAVLDDLISQVSKLACTYLELTGRPLPVDGELGELYARRRLGIDLYQHNVDGADGFERNGTGGFEVQIKTISPSRTRRKRKRIVRVKRKAKWSKLAIVSLGADYQCDGVAMATKQGLKDAFKANGGNFGKKTKPKPVSLDMLQKAALLDSARQTAAAGFVAVGNDAPVSSG